MERSVEFEPVQAPRWRETIARVGLALGLIASSCATEAPAETVSAPELAESLIDNFTDTQVPEKASTTQAPTTLESTTTTEAPTTTTSTTSTSSTTTTTQPEPFWVDRIYQDNGCDEGETLQIRIQGENGNAVGVQASWDYESHDFARFGEVTKVDNEGNPIERFISYSGHTYLNPELPSIGGAGVTEMCLENIPPHVVAYIEVYKVLPAENGFVGDHEVFGNAMSHAIYPGPNQMAVISLPMACRPEEGLNGTAGNIQILPTVNGQPANSIRTAGWEYWQPNQRWDTSWGFDANDTLYTREETEDMLEILSPGEYLTQFRVQDLNGNTYEAVIDGVDVSPCETVQLTTDIDASTNTCTSISHAQGREYDCSLDRYIG